MVIAKIIIHLLTYSIYELHRDEMFYFALGMHLDFGYLSNGPFIGFLAFLSRIIFGYSEFGLKIFPILSGVATIIIIGIFVKETGGKSLSVSIACLAYIVSPAYLRSNLLFMPVSFDELFWLLTFYLTVRMVHNENSKGLIPLAIVLSIAFLNKYSILFLMAGIFISLFLSPYRKLLWSKYFVFSVLIGLIIIMPNVLWQYSNNWPVVMHMAELKEKHLVHVNPGDFLLNQILMNFPVVLVWLIGFFSLLFVRKFSKFRFLGYSFIIIILLFIFTRGKAYYTLGLYPMLFVFGSIAIEKFFTNRMAFFKYIIILIAVINGFLLLPYALPLMSYEKLEKYCEFTSKITGPGLITWEDGVIHTIPQDFADMNSWDELAGIVAKAYNKLDENEKENCIIFCHNYGSAGAVQFYGNKYGLPEPVCFHDTYKLWAPDSIAERVNFIYINHEIGDIDKLFNEYSEIGYIDNEYFRENGLKVYLCKKPKSHFTTFYANKINSLRMIYQN